MMITNYIFSISAFFVLTNADPQIHSLSSVLSLTDVTYLNVEIGSRLFVASNDNADFLKQITAKVGNTQYTLDILASSSNTDGTQGSVTINDKLSLSTLNNDTVTSSLTGFIYITTADQAKDANFSVYAASKNLTISKITTLDVQTTAVVLNTKLLQPNDKWYMPEKSAFVSNFNQPQTSTVQIFRGFPSSNATQDNKEKMIFTNPVPLLFYYDNNTSYEKKEFFNHVEPLQILLNCWFIKATGTFSLTVENKWSDFTNYHTNSPTSTGLIMTDSYFQKTDVSFEPTAPNGISGTFITVNINDNQQLSVIYFGDAANFQQNYTGSETLTQAMISSDFSAARLTVSASFVPGEFYIQYFVIDGPPQSSTIAPSTISGYGNTDSTIDGSKTTTIWSTTKSSDLCLNISLISLICIFKAVLN